MYRMYNLIEELCQSKNIKVGKMCSDLDISRGVIGDLKAGRTKTLSAQNVAKISDYFGVTTDYLLTGEKQKAPTDGEREITFDDFTFAFYKESKDLPEEKKKMLLDMARFMKADLEKEEGK